MKNICIWVLVLALLLTGCAASPAAQPVPVRAADCRAAAQEIRTQFGIQTAIFQEAIPVAPWDYALTPANRAAEVLEALGTVEEALGEFPTDFLPRLWKNWDGLTLCLVEKIVGTGGPGTLPSAQGLQFEVENEGYLVLAITPKEEVRSALIHEIGHLLDRVLSKNPSYISQWNALNPPGFSYDPDIAPEELRDLLQGESRCFTDAYAARYGEEDRARILECAMSPGNEELFASPGLHRKLHRLCTEIRENFPLDEKTVPLWEQYL